MVTDAVDAVTSGTSTIYNTSTIMVAAYSATNDPTGTWHMYAVTIDPTNAAWMDFPNVMNKNKWITDGDGQ